MFRRIPRHYAAASLKLDDIAKWTFKIIKYSAALRRGLIEAYQQRSARLRPREYSAALRRGLIEAQRGGTRAGER